MPNRGVPLYVTVSGTCANDRCGQYFERVVHRNRHKAVKYCSRICNRRASSRRQHARLMAAKKPRNFSHRPSSARTLLDALSLNPTLIKNYGDNRTVKGTD